MSSSSSIFSNLDFTKSSSSSTSSTIPSIGFIVIVKAFKIPSSSLSSESSSGSVSLKVAVKTLLFFNSLEISWTFLFHMFKTLTSETF